MKDFLGDIQEVAEAVLSAEDEEQQTKMFLVLIQGEQAGPFPESTIQTKILSGEVSRDDFCWTEGMAEWQPTHTVITLPSLPEPPLPEPPSPEAPSANPPSKQGNSILAQVQGFICDIAGLPALEGFKLSHLFSEVFRWRSRDEVDTYFTCGSPKSTPDLAEVSSDWPRPWFYLRMLIFGLVVLLGFSFAAHIFANTNMIPGIIIVGAFFVPLSCAALFFEFNVVRNISLFEVMKCIVAGATISMIIALLLYKFTGLNQTFLGDTAAGIVEETAKVVAAVVLIRGTLQYKWILNGLLVGAAVGAGFAGFETAGYIFNSLLLDLDKCKDLSTFYGTLEQRAIFAPFCHVVWTASVVGALWRVKKDAPFRAAMFFHRDFLRVFAFVILLHMLWNSPFHNLFLRNAFLLKAETFLALLSYVGSWYLAFLLVQQGLFQVRDAKRLSSQPSIDGADTLTFENSQIPLPPPTPQPSVACSASELQWIVLLHLSALVVIPIATVLILNTEQGGILYVAIILISPVLGPFVLWLMKKAMSPAVDAAGRNVLNFQISWMIWLILLIVACGIGRNVMESIEVFIDGFIIAWIIFTILGAVKAGSRLAYKYPLTIKML